MLGTGVEVEGNKYLPEKALRLTKEADRGGTVVIDICPVKTLQECGWGG